MARRQLQLPRPDVGVDTFAAGGTIVLVAVAAFFASLFFTSRRS